MPVDSIRGRPVKPAGPAERIVKETGMQRQVAMPVVLCWLFLAGLAAGCGQEMQGRRCPRGVPRLTVRACWPEQKLPNNTIHKMRVARGGEVDVVAVIEPGGVDLKDSKVQVTTSVPLELTDLLVGGEPLAPSPAVTVELQRPKEVRWTFRLPWRPREARSDYRFEVTVSPPRRRWRGRRPGGYNSKMIASVTVEQGVGCYDTTVLRRLKMLAESPYCKLEKIGKSALGRDMYLIRATDWSVPHAKKKQLVIIGPYHGDEPSGVETCLDFLYELITVPRRKAYLRRMVFYVIPSHNPDGHETCSHWGTHKIDPGNYSYEHLKIPEAVAVAAALGKYGKDFTDALAIVHHQWGRDYTLISHIDTVPRGRCPSYELVRNMSVAVSNELDIPMYPIYGVQSPHYTGVRGFMAVELKMPNYTLENTGIRTFNLGGLMKHVERELAIYYATIDQMLAPRPVRPKVRAAKKLRFPAERNYEAYKTAQPPVIDARLDEPCWQGPTVIRNFRRIGRPGREVPATSARVAYDDERLYVAFKAEQLARPSPAGLGGPDAVEVMLDTNLNQWTYYHFQVNADGDIRRSYYSCAGISDNAAFDARGCKAAVCLDSGTVEMSIPLACFNHAGRVDPPIPIPIPDGTVWGANFVRSRHGKVAESGWARTTSGNSHRPWQFNAITFMGPKD